jgi:hypothetical protein
MDSPEPEWLTWWARCVAEPCLPVGDYSGAVFLVTPSSRVWLAFEAEIGLAGLTPDAALDNIVADADWSEWLKVETATHLADAPWPNVRRRAAPPRE